VARFLGVGMTHYPLLAGTDEHMAGLLRFTLRDPDIPAAEKDPANWPPSMRADWSDDGGTAAAAKHREVLTSHLARCRADLDAFDLRHHRRLQLQQVLRDLPGGLMPGTFIEAKGIRTHYHDAGEGDPVVLLHGSGPGVSAWANWQHTIPALARANRVLAFDLVGYGATERPPDIRYSLRSWADHVWAFLDALGHGQVSVVGNSLGGRSSAR
jgi:hypothetical protein